MQRGVRVVNVNGAQRRRCVQRVVEVVARFPQELVLVLHAVPPIQKEITNDLHGNEFNGKRRPGREQFFVRRHHKLKQEETQHAIQDGREANQIGGDVGDLFPP